MDEDEPAGNSGTTTTIPVADDEGEYTTTNVDAAMNTIEYDEDDSEETDESDILYMDAATHGS